jgi:hypothetical protein
VSDASGDFAQVVDLPQDADLTAPITIKLGIKPGEKQGGYNFRITETGDYPMVTAER